MKKLLFGICLLFGCGGGGGITGTYSGQGTATPLVSLDGGIDALAPTEAVDLVTVANAADGGIVVTIDHCQLPATETSSGFSAEGASGGCLGITPSGNECGVEFISGTITGSVSGNTLTVSAIGTVIVYGCGGMQPPTQDRQEPFALAFTGKR